MAARHTDVFIAGAGPAGLAAAIAARQHGFRVLLSDHSHPPIDKACGEGLMPDAIPALRELGISLHGYNTGPIAGIRFLGQSASVEARFPDSHGVGIRRTLLHEILLRRAEELGVDMVWGARVTGGDNVLLLDGRPVVCRWIVGADGQNSQIRRWAGFSSGSTSRARIGLRQHFSVPPWSEFVEVYWGETGQAYVTPVGRNEVGIALLLKHRSPSFDHGLAQFPPLARRLEKVRCCSSVRGAPTFTRRLLTVVRGRVALIGDASGSVDAITGQGVSLAFHQALALGRALAANDLSAYQAAHRGIMAVPQAMARMLLLLDKSRWLRHRALRALAHQPELFEQLLAVHTGKLRFADFSLRSLFDLSREILVRGDPPQCSCAPDR